MAKDKMSLFLVAIVVLLFFYWMMSQLGQMGQIIFYGVLFLGVAGWAITSVSDGLGSLFG